MLIHVQPVVLSIAVMHSEHTALYFRIPDKLWPGLSVPSLYRIRNGLATGLIAYPDFWYITLDLCSWHTEHFISHYLVASVVRCPLLCLLESCSFWYPYFVTTAAPAFYLLVRFSYFLGPIEPPQIAKMWHWSM